MQSLAQLMHCAVSLDLLQLGFLLHQEDSRARFLYRGECEMLTGMIGMLHQLLEPLLRDCDAIILRVIILDLEPLTRSLLDDVFHVLLAQGAHHTKEEVTLREAV